MITNPIDWASEVPPVKSGLYNNLYTKQYEFYDKDAELIMFSKKDLPDGSLMYLIEELNYVWQSPEDFYIPSKFVH